VRRAATNCDPGAVEEHVGTGVHTEVWRAATDPDATGVAVEHPGAATQRDRAGIAAADVEPGSVVEAVVARLEEEAIPRDVLNADAARPAAGPGRRRHLISDRVRPRRECAAARRGRIAAVCRLAREVREYRWLEHLEQRVGHFRAVGVLALAAVDHRRAGGMEAVVGD